MLTHLTSSCCYGTTFKCLFSCFLMQCTFGKKKKDEQTKNYFAVAFQHKNFFHIKINNTELSCLFFLQGKEAESFISLFPLLIPLLLCKLDSVSHKVKHLCSSYSYDSLLSFLIFLDLNSYKSFSTKIDIYMYCLSIIGDLINREGWEAIFSWQKSIEFAMTSVLYLRLTFFKL